MYVCLKDSVPVDNPTDMQHPFNSPSLIYAPSSLLSLHPVLMFMLFISDGEMGLRTHTHADWVGTDWYSFVVMLMFLSLCEKCCLWLITVSWFANTYGKTQMSSFSAVRWVNCHLIMLFCQRFVSIPFFFFTLVFMERIHANVPSRSLEN